VNGTSVERKTLLQVLDLIEEDPVKVDLLVIDKETEQEFTKRREVPSRKLSRKPPGASSGSTHIVTIGELSTEPYPPAPAHDGKLGKKGKPAKAAKPKATTKSKAANKGGTKANAAEVSKAEAELLKKFVQARATESADADQGADDGRSATDRQVRGLRGRRARAHGRDRGVNNGSGISGNAPSTLRSTSPLSPNDSNPYGGAFVDDAGTDAAGYYWPNEQYPWAPPPSPTYAPPFSVPGSPSYAPTIFPASPYDAHSPMSGAGAYMPYSHPGSPFWSPSMLPGMLPYQTPYMPFVQMPGFYGFPYASPTYPDFSPYSANFPRYPYPGGRSQPVRRTGWRGRRYAAASGGILPQSQRSERAQGQAGKSKAKDLASPSARHRDH
ncbi:hypothetical protein MTO96_043645, partial [Rhipicephalus appendiculatus]